jgi:hypothetical protein
MGCAGGAAGLPVRAVALKDGGEVLGGDAVEVQMQLVDCGRERALPGFDRLGSVGLRPGRTPARSCVCSNRGVGVRRPDW